ncbi:MAG: DUF2938 domain-containing protein [Proteobacteria bacterium]|nr:DUF2938 domain-containing protein [Pseudomonadota bacterium]
MNEGLEFVLRAILIGIGATLVLDTWALFLKRVFGIAGANWGFVGRWIGHFPRGQFVHADIAKTAPVRGERVIGWIAHYVIGMIFAAILLAGWGLGWTHRPTLLPALVIGVGTVVAPFFLMQPAMGAGIAASKMPKPNIARVRSLVTHAVFGVGLYGAAMFVARFVIVQS